MFARPAARRLNPESSMNAIPRPRFHVIAIMAIAALVFAGFARTFYLGFWFDAPLLTRLLQLHGAMFTAWLALHYTQARLISARRVDLHMRLGIFGAALGYTMFLVGVATAVQSAASGHQPTDAPPLVFMSMPVGTIVAFAALLTAALVMRRRADWHKRLMLLATIALIIPAAARLSSYFTGRNNPAIGIVLTVVLVAWCCIEDRRRIGRVHPAYKIAGALLILSLPARMLVGYTDAWQHFAQWLVGFAPAMSLN
jgi:signal transduction histidine kinase